MRPSARLRLQLQLQRWLPSLEQQLWPTSSPWCTSGKRINKTWAQRNGPPIELIFLD